MAAKCGNPTAAERHEERARTLRGICLRTTVDLWSYDRGPSEFVRTLAFRDGVLSDVTVGSYGH